MSAQFHTLRFLVGRFRPVVRRASTVLVTVIGACIAISAFASEALPDNAHTKLYGGGWECDRGFSEQSGSCVAIEVPQNAYLDSFGYRWSCRRGYRKVDNHCQVVTVPTNAYLTDDSFGPGWSCERGYRANGTACTAIDVPANAYLVDEGLGRDWECHRGYRRSRDTCAVVDIPDNGYLLRGGVPIGAAHAVFVSAGIPAWQSLFPRTAISIRWEAIGDVTAAFARWRQPALHFQCRRIRTLTIPATNGNAIPGIGGKATDAR